LAKRIYVSTTSARRETMRADRVEFSWDERQANWLIRIVSLGRKWYGDVVRYRKARMSGCYEMLSRKQCETRVTK
jgi:hypothetical protein